MIYLVFNNKTQVLQNTMDREKKIINIKEHRKIFYYMISFRNNILMELKVC